MVPAQFCYVVEGIYSMSHLKFTILQRTLHKPKPEAHATVITFEELKGWIIQDVVARRLFYYIAKHLFRYQETRLITYRVDVILMPFVTALLLRLLSRNICYFEDEQGHRQAITPGVLAKLLWQFVRDLARTPSLLRRTYQEVEYLGNNRVIRQPVKLDLSATPVYLRTDMLFGLRAGGSVGHIAGVLNYLDEFTERPVLLTTDIIPTVRKDIETYLIHPGEAFWDFRELLRFHFNDVFEQNAHRFIKDRKLSFVYQRYSLNNYSGVKLSGAYNIPFALEYNGSEIWINRHWGKPLRYETLSERIELLNLQAADVIVVVSQPMRDELVARGIEAAKILVNPNGVNPELYSAEIDGSSVRQEYNLDGKTVIGFIGTFGKWHGAEVLAEAFGRLLQKFPKYREGVRLLMIGDGPTMPMVRERLTRFGVGEVSILTGLIPQENGPTHLAACDILISPHVPNPDGTPFFGSPTKLFEYMAMEKGIIASKLNQIGEVLKHNETAWMVKPGDVESLMEGLKTLIENEDLRDRLGEAARREVVARYTWREHTRKIIEKLKEWCGQ
jgi:glycosyltransferase involved in cell wall biosynthesis